MSPGDHSTSATSRNLIGAVRSNALSGVTQPERALVFLRTRRGAQLVPLVSARDREARRAEPEKSRGYEEEGTMMHIGRV